MSTSGRPLSPHLSIYRWPITMVLSIMHRVSGVALSVGLLVFTAWLMAAASGAASYADFTAIMGSVIGRIALAGWSLAFFFHLANGVRHLIWDTGRGFEREQASASAWFVIGFTLLATALYWWLL